VTEFEVRALQELKSISRAAWAIAWLIALGLIVLSSLARVSSETYDEELDTHYALEQQL